ncbi:SLBB domain-containing protein [Rubrivirga marina]|uniref:Soluble ligand binding domain-containing protein n=1 Tax=Rubrivirga marina TaxID=1196024 RepID=A0A271J0X6_9BACT|nr:SLBB domain-containing protein [Rubrivirga marina]PAP77152.1 hypothetical protein BSZ37_12290 [Rubrivirga marina]
MRRLAVLVFLAASVVASAQPTDERGVLGLVEGREATPGGYFYNALPGQPVTRVYVWGRVLRPGVYDVGPDFDLGGVLSMAGVTSERTPLEGDPELMLRLFRAGQTEPVYETTVDRFVADPAAPDIEYGDVIAVEAEGVARVAVIGSVLRPGTYEVGPTFSSRDALALAGGPRLDPLESSAERTTTVRIFRTGGGEEPDYRETLQSFLGGPAPALQDGDVIEVETRIKEGWSRRDVLTAAGVVTSGVIAAVQLYRVLSAD